MSEAKPLFLLAGGSPRDARSMAAAFAQALKECDREKPRVAYVGTANGDSVPFYWAMKALIQQAGAGEVSLVPLAKAKVDVSAAEQALQAADAIFISGGEVYDGMRWLTRHGLAGFLSELRNQGKVFFGVSAGTIMMGTHWVQWEDEDDDSTARLFDCLGFAPTTLDTHAEDEDWKELKMALKLQGPGARGYGIPRGGMVIVDSQGQMTAPEKPLVPYVNDEGQVRRA